MTVRELVKILIELEQDREIRFSSYEYTIDFKVACVVDKGGYYNIIDPEEKEYLKSGGVI